MNLINNNNYFAIQLSNYIEIENAQLLEKEYILKYKNKNYKILNKTKGGEIGSINSYWSEELILKKAKEYKTYQHFKNNKKLYNAANRNLLLNKIKTDCFNIKPTKKLNISNEELIAKIQNTYFSYDQLLRDKKMYNIINGRKLIKKIKEQVFNIQHETKKIKNWNKNKIYKEAKKYKSYYNFKKI